MSNIVKTLLPTNTISHLMHAARTKKMMISQKSTQTVDER